MIHRAVYGGKEAGINFRNHLRSCMRYLDLTYFLGDPNVWISPAKISNGTSYYRYILLYTDYALIVSQHAEETLGKDLGRYFELKQDSIGLPKICLGGHCRRVQFDNCV